MSIDFLAKAVA